MLNDRIDTPVSTDEKEKFRKHALAVHGMKLAVWIRMLMNKDYRSHNKPRD